MRPRRSLSIVTLIFLSLAAFYCVGETSGQQLALRAGQSLIGAPAPRLVLQTIDGDTIDLDNLYGKRAIYLKFWATWCTPCRQQMPHFQHVYETAGTDLAVIAIDVGFNDTVDAIRAYRKKLGITMPVVFDADGQIGAALHLRVTPQHIVIGRDGRIRYVGHLADARLDAALLAAREGSSALPMRTAPGSSSTSIAARYGIGDSLPAQTVRTLDGQMFQLRGTESSEGTVLVFLSPWCESYLAKTRPIVATNCRKTRTQVAALAHNKYLRWLGIASGLWATAEDLQAYRANFKVNIPLTLDDTGALFREFSVNNTPTLVVANAKETIVRRIEASDAGKLRQALEGL